MSDRFYMQMREATGWAPGLPEFYKTTKRRRKVAWTDEAKAQAVEMYTAEEPTPENSMEIVKSDCRRVRREPKRCSHDIDKSWCICQKNTCC